MNNKQPIRPTLTALRKGSSAVFPLSRYESVVSTVTRLNRVVPAKRWSVNIVKDNPDNDEPQLVRVTRTL